MTLSIQVRNFSIEPHQSTPFDLRLSSYHLLCCLQRIRPTASRMESTGVKGRIHISQATRDLLCQSGLNAWVQERGTTISVKGKGDMQTYWLLSRAEQTAMENQAAGQAPKRGSISMGSSVARKSTKGKSDSSQARLVMWNIRILNALLKQIVAARGKNNNRRGELPTFKPSSGGLTVLDEVKEIITLPEKKLDNHSHAADVVLPEAVKSQLEEYVMAISRVYRNNPFHNFEHASHVTQSVAKLMSRIVAPDTIDYDDMCYKSKEASALHDHTYGIVSYTRADFVKAQLAFFSCTVFHVVSNMYISCYFLAFFALCRPLIL